MSKMRKPKIIKVVKRNEWMLAYVALILQILALWGQYHQQVIILKETEYRTNYVIEPLADTTTVTDKLMVFVIRANGTVEDPSKPPLQSVDFSAFHLN